MMVPTVNTWSNPRSCCMMILANRTISWVVTWRPHMHNRHNANTSLSCTGSNTASNASFSIELSRNRRNSSRSIKLSPSASSLSNSFIVPYASSHSCLSIFLSPFLSIASASAAAAVAVKVRSPIFVLSRLVPALWLASCDIV